eukprot:TRINITY_DN5549_c0_g1_i1.p1 TRINITY_DN5549_c0_g1~~TRINITY_DN5549_c0_g1_i1.p1  ORF type:complete len:120 (-),score=4.40 TRINITY_DN5549_c0_g1_i1:35-394(-)
MQFVVASLASLYYANTANCNNSDPKSTQDSHSLFARTQRKTLPSPTIPTILQHVPTHNEHSLSNTSFTLHDGALPMLERVLEDISEALIAIDGKSRVEQEDREGIEWWEVKSLLTCVSY